jgi:hypothetical protein
MAVCLLTVRLSADFLETIKLTVLRTDLNQAELNQLVPFKTMQNLSNIAQSLISLSCHTSKPTLNRMPGGEACTK